MIGHNQMSAVAEAKSGSINAAGIKLVDFFIQNSGIDDDTIPDNRNDTGIKDTGGRQAEPELPEGINDTMAGVIAAGETYHVGGLLRQHIHHSTFAFVSPLCPDYSYNRHLLPPIAKPINSTIKGAGCLQVFYL
jgi:hypothetical protein